MFIFLLLLFHSQIVSVDSTFYVINVCKYVVIEKTLFHKVENMKSCENNYNLRKLL